MNNSTVLFSTMLLILTAGWVNLSRDAKSHFVWHAAALESDDFTATGKASWYGAKFTGQETASGEPFDHAELTGAHRTLPLGSRVRVINLENNKSVIVEINDRGPFVEDRLIDVSAAAARALEMKEDGVVDVRIEVLAPNEAQP